MRSWYHRITIGQWPHMISKLTFYFWRQNTSVGNRHLKTIDTFSFTYKERAGLSNVAVVPTEAIHQSQTILTMNIEHPRFFPRSSSSIRGESVVVASHPPPRMGTH